MRRAEKAYLRDIAARMTSLAGVFPDFRYVELRGKAINKPPVWEAALGAFTDDLPRRVLLTDDAVCCLYAREIDGAWAAFTLACDEITKGLRCSFRAAGAGAEAARVPLMRGERAPFAMAASMLHVTDIYPRTLGRQLRPTGLKVVRLPHAPDVFQGPVTVGADGDSIVFPGNMIVPCTDSPKWRQLQRAATRGELQARYTLEPIFGYVAAYFETAAWVPGGANRAIERMVAAARPAKPNSDDPGGRDAGKDATHAPGLRRGSNDRKVSQASREEQTTPDVPLRGRDPALRVDETRFLIWYKGKPYKYRGPPRLFALIAKLVDEPGRHVYFDDLRLPDGLWGESRVEDSTLSGHVSRLRKRLTLAGLPEIAERLIVETYGNRRYVVLDAIPANPD
jgi:hypothetical protein